VPVPTLNRVVVVYHPYIFSRIIVHAFNGNDNRDAL
jgi:hypothetical protein